MNDLDDKLKLLLEDHVDYWHRKERYTTPLKTGELTFIEQIKQVFTDAGYLTGQEWFNRFDRELSQEIPGFATVMVRRILAIAKRAAGIT